MIGDEDDQKKPSILSKIFKQAISYGGQKIDGGHDHRTNKGEDRTPAQKVGDKSRRKEKD